MLNGLNLVEVSQCSLCILAFWLVSHHISRTESFQQNRLINFLALVALKLLVSLISRLVACSARIVVDKHTNKHTDRQTDRQTHRTTTVTLAAHARRGLTSCDKEEIQTVSTQETTSHTLQISYLRPSKHQSMDAIARIHNLSRLQGQSL